MIKNTYRIEVFLYHSSALKHLKKKQYHFQIEYLKDEIVVSDNLWILIYFLRVICRNIFVMTL